MRLVPVTDPALLQQLNSAQGQPVPVTDPALLQQLNAPDAPQGADPNGVIPSVQPPAPSPDFMHKAQLGGQAVAQGLIGDALGAPADMKALFEWATGEAVDLGRKGINYTAIPAANKVLSLAGVPGEIPEIPEFPNYNEMRQKLNDRTAEDFASWGMNPDTAKTAADFHMPGGDEIGQFASDTLASAGVEPAEPQNLSQELGYNIARFGSGALLPGAPDKKAKFVQGLAGAGAGTAVTFAEEYLPDSLKGPLAMLIAALGGHTAGRTTGNAVTLGKEGLVELAKKRMPAGPEYAADGKTPNISSVDQAAKHFQSNTTDLATALSDIQKGTQDFGKMGGEMPATAQLTDDVGLRLMDKAARSNVRGNPKLFRSLIEKDQRVSNDAKGDIQTIRNPNADLEAPKTSALNEIERRTADARGNVAAQESQLAQTLRQTGDDLGASVAAEEALARPYAHMKGKSVREDASVALDKAVVDDTMRPMAADNSRMAKEIDPDATAQVSSQPLRDAIAEVEDSAKYLTATTKSQAVPEALLADLKTLSENDTIPFRTLTDHRAALSAMEKKARQAKDFVLADNIRKLKNATNTAAKDLAASGDEAGVRAGKFLRNYEEEFAPLFAQGEGGKLRKDINADDLARTNTPPSKTAGRFLATPEKAADLNRISEHSGNPDITSATKKFLQSDMADKSIKDGKFSVDDIQQWLNDKGNVAKAAPGNVVDEMADLLREAGMLTEKTAATKASGSKAVALRKSAVKDAEDNLTETNIGINRSALSHYVGKNTDKATGAILSSGDPVASIKELKGRFAGDVAAQEGLKAAAADHFVNLVTTADGTTPTFAKLSQVFKKHEPEMRELFGDDVAYMQQAQKRLEALSKRSIQAIPGSDTAEKSGLARMSEVAMKPIEIIIRMTMGALEGGSQVRKMRLGLDQLPDGSKAANDLIKRAILDPEVAKLLLARNVKEIGTPKWNAELMARMRWVIAGREASKEQEDDHSREQ